MSKLAIFLLGPFQVTQAGQPVTEFETDLARALLAYLVMHVGRSFPREALAALFWPESPTAEALHALRQTLNRLRSALGADDLQNPLLQVTRQSIQFNPGSDFWLDVAAFNACLAATHQHPHRRLENCQSCNRQLLQASQLWRGDFLSGLNINSQDFQDWQTSSGEHLRIQAIETFEHLANHYEQHGNAGQARFFAWRQLELEAWREEAHRQLMRILAGSGQRSAAISQYETCRQVLDDELGVEPSDETTALYRQIRAGKLPQTEPPASNLPVYLTAFVGRENELEQISGLLQQRDCRLLSLVGLGGMGKTRLAVQAASREAASYRDGVVFVSLAALNSPAQVLPTLAHALQLNISPQQDLKTQLCKHLRSKEQLVIFDNFEQVLEAAGELNDLLRAAPGLQVLVSSRERLNLQGEWVHDVHGLAYACQGLPEGGPECSAMQLFAQVARRVRPDFSSDRNAIEQICRLVDGMPLAIELAASWARSLSGPEIAQEIRRDFGFLQTRLRDLPEQHRSLQAVFASSWAMLNDEERKCLRQLAVFHGGFEHEAAAAVSGATPALLAALVDKSWLRQDQRNQEIRYGLHDLVQRYAARQLEDEPQLKSAAQTRHAEYYTAWIGQQLAALKGNDQRPALHKIGIEIENARAAWSWSITNGSTAGIDLAWESLFLFHDLQGWFAEGESAFGQLAQAFEQAQDPAGRIMRGRGLACQGWFASKLGQVLLARMLLGQGLAVLQSTEARYDLALALCNQAVILMNLGLAGSAKEPFNASLSIFQELGDQERIVMTLNYLGHVSYRLGNTLDALRYCQAGLELARSNQLRQREADCLHSLGDICVHISQISEASEYYKQSLERYQQVNDPQGLSDTLVDLGMCTCVQGQYEAALDYLTRALPIKQNIGDRPGEALALMKLGHVTQKQDHPDLSLQHYEQGLSIVRETGDRRTEGELFVGLSTLASRQGDWATGMSRIRQGLEIFKEIGDRVAYADGLESLARMSLEQGDFSTAQAQFEETMAISNETGYQWGTSAALLGLGERSYHCGDAQTARIYARQALQQAAEMQIRPLQAGALLLLGHTLSAPEEQSEALESYQGALDIYQALGRPQNACEALAGLANLALTQGDLMRANELVAEILNLLETNSLDGSNNPLQVYLTCYRVLCAAQDARAAELLNAGYELLQARAARTGSPSLKGLYLENFPAHRELCAAWEKCLTP